MGEENLFAHFAVNMGTDGHDFVTDSESESPINIDQLRYERLLASPQYIAKKRADHISYVWDHLIETFTTHMLRGTSLIPDGRAYELTNSEIGVRFMALERRFVRRELGSAVASAMRLGMENDCFRRAFIRDPGSPECDTAYFFQTLKFDAPAFRHSDYQEYRWARRKLAEVYALGVLERTSHIRRVIGVSCEPPGGDRNTSEDLLYAEQHDWTEEDRMKIRANCAQLQMLQPGMKWTRFNTDEFPQVR